MHDACSPISQIASKTTSQRLPKPYPPRICNQSWNWSRNKKVENALFAFPKILNMINPQTNTTKVVIRTLLPLKGICNPSKKISNISQPISPAKSIFQPNWAIFRGHYAPHGIHSSQMHSSIQYHNMYSSTIMQHNQSNIPVIMHPNNVFILWHLKMIPIFIWLCSTKVPFMSLCHTEFHKLGIYPEQIACFITNHANITLK